ncbi:MAG: hypothetical protein ACRCXM_12805 [Beijerinckiaceae bacterium]
MFKAFKIMTLTAGLALASTGAMAQRGGGNGGGGGGGGEGAGGSGGNDAGIYSVLHAPKLKAAAPARPPRVVRPRNRGGNPSSENGCNYNAAWVGIVASNNCDLVE